VILRRLSFLLLLAACTLAPQTGSPHPVRFENGSRCHQQTPVEGLLVPTPTIARPQSISPFSPWRYRLKSVLQETDSRIIQESDLGPVPLPGRFYASVVPTRRTVLSRTAIPLRC